jgi:4-hydroxy-3-methylbut-2-enyl diphosphate reductase
MVGAKGAVFPKEGTSMYYAPAVVERVWKKSNKLGADKYTILLHGKYNHEETRATFSRSEQDAASIILLDIAEARLIGDVIQGRMDQASFMERFKGRFSAGFDPARDLQRIGVINQTTMLATETQEIADYMRQVMIGKYGEADIKNHFSDTRDTLCYATNENQQATYGLLKQQADLALVVGGYNSSNTSHLVELCEEKLPTYYISSEREIQSAKEIRHFNFHTHELLSTANYLPAKSPVDILLTSGASCPDAVVENVLLKVLSYFENTRPVDELAEEMRAMLPKK